MKKLFTSLALMLSLASLYAQPVLMSDSLKTGHAFNLYSLSGVNVANLTPVGPNVTWDVSTATATSAGTAELQDMASTPYAVQYPMANFAIKFTMGAATQYSLFILSATKLEEVANNVGATAVNFIDYRTTLVFPFGYGLSDTDTYQKAAQAVKTITNTYTGHGNFITNTGTVPNVVQNTINDDGSTNVLWWNSSPLVPLFQAGGTGFVLWKSTAAPNAVVDYSSNVAFDLYPNPAANTLHIINKELISKMEVYSLAGQFQFSTVSSVIDISKLKEGVYFLKVHTAKGVTSQRFIKK